MNWYSLQPAPLPVSQALDEYGELPASIRALYTFEQYQWLSEAEKARLIQTETEPDQYGD